MLISIFFLLEVKKKLLKISHLMKLGLTFFNLTVCARALSLLAQISVMIDHTNEVPFVLIHLKFVTIGLL